MPIKHKLSISQVGYIKWHTDKNKGDSDAEKNLKKYPKVSAFFQTKTKDDNMTRWGMICLHNNNQVVIVVVDFTPIRLMYLIHFWRWWRWYIF